jgi:hypothetical protein
MNDLSDQNSLREDPEILDLLRRWINLSSFQKRALLGLANEVQTSCDLLETSVRDLSEHFMQLASIAQTQESRVNSSGDKARLFSDNIAEIVTKMQFQDRTNQRLSLIISTLKVIAESSNDLEGKTFDLTGNKPSDSEDTEWINPIIEKLHLGEMKERFIRHVLFDEPHVGDTSIDHVKASDDIELF